MVVVGRQTFALLLLLLLLPLTTTTTTLTGTAKRAKSSRSTKTTLDRGARPPAALATTLRILDRRRPRHPKGLL